MVANLKKWSKAKLGTGSRFEKLSGELEEKGADDPDALAASIGRSRLGKEKFQALATAGRKRKG